jgi:4-alpha-glucanotransferase
MFFHIGYLVTFLYSIGTVPCTSFQQGDLDASRLAIMSVARSLLVIVEDLGYVVLCVKSEYVLRQTGICGV